MTHCIWFNNPTDMSWKNLSSRGSLHLDPSLPLFGGHYIHLPPPIWLAASGWMNLNFVLAWLPWLPHPPLSWLSVHSSTFYLSPGMPDCRFLLLLGFLHLGPLFTISFASIVASASSFMALCIWFHLLPGMPDCRLFLAFFIWVYLLPFPGMPDGRFLLLHGFLHLGLPFTFTLTSLMAAFSSFLAFFNWVYLLPLPWHPWWPLPPPSWLSRFGSTFYFCPEVTRFPYSLFVMAHNIKLNLLALPWHP